MKKYFYISCFFAFILCFSIKSNASDISFSNKEIKTYISDYHADQLLFASNYDNLLKYIYNAAINRKGTIVYCEFDNEKNIDEIISDVIRIDYSNSLSDAEGLWGNMIGYNHAILKRDSSFLFCINFNYRRTEKEMKLVEEKIDSDLYKLDIKNDDSYEIKIKKVHDYVCNYFDYDYTLKNIDEYGGYFEKIDNKNLMVCQGYSLLTYKLLNKLNINCKIILSKEHSWNIVQLEDGLWYHLDCTSDDIGNNEFNYEYFLKPAINDELHNFYKSSVLYSNINDYKFGTNNITKTEFLYLMNKSLSSGNLSYGYDAILKLNIDKITIFFISVILVLNIFLFIFFNNTFKKIKKSKESKFKDYNSI